MTKLALLMQASEDAKKLVNQEKSFACAEIESARAVVQRIGEALDEQERNHISGKQQVSFSTNYFISCFLFSSTINQVHVHENKMGNGFLKA